MADNEKEGVETSASTADWEVVSLTASTYAAAPGPEGIDIADKSEDKEFDKTEVKTSSAMFKSGHFITLPIEHENLLLDPGNIEILAESRVQDVDTIVEEADIPLEKQEEDWSTETLSHVDVHGIQFFDKGKRLRIHDVEFEENQVTLQDLDLVKKGQHVHEDSAAFNSFQAETVSAGSVPCDEISVPDDPSNENSHVSSKPIKQSECNQSGLPCEVWWKRQAASLYAHAKEASTFWSLCVAAALMGLVILGQRWQQGRLQFQHLKTHFSVNDEIRSWLRGAVSRFKYVATGSHHRVPVIRGGASGGR